MSSLSTSSIASKRSSASSGVSISNDVMPAPVTEAVANLTASRMVSLVNLECCDAPKCSLMRRYSALILPASRPSSGARSSALSHGTGRWPLAN